MPRQNRRRTTGVRPVGRGGDERTDTLGGLEYTVRTITGAAATKPYRCPGCEQIIPIGTPHVVAWPYDDLDADDRRHWHRACWQSRERRSPRRRG